MHDLAVARRGLPGLPAQATGIRRSQLEQSSTDTDSRVSSHLDADRTRNLIVVPLLGVLSPYRLNINLSHEVAKKLPRPTRKDGACQV